MRELDKNDVAEYISADDKTDIEQPYPGEI
jgi:hypothetical protein